MYNKVEFFNTPVVEGRKIIEYKGIVHASQVAGTGFLTDIFASISDFMGTNSLLYTAKMNLLCEELYSQLETLAISKGANAVIGIHIDFDSISPSNGNSMFMASAQGTAVVLEESALSVEGNIDAVDCKILEQKVFIKGIAPKLSNYTVLSHEEWKLIIHSADSSIADSLHKIYVSIDKTVDINSECAEWIENYEKYFCRLPYDKQIELAYSTCTELPLILKYNLFDADKILMWAKDKNITFAISCLEAKKLSYNNHDIHGMKELYNYLSNLPDKGKIEEVKQGINPNDIQDAEEYYSYLSNIPDAGQFAEMQNDMYSSKILQFVCECGRKNDYNEIFCKSCGKNIKGLTLEQVKLIEELKQKISILEELLKEKS